MAATRLSLVAEFDDLTRSHNVLSSSVEREFTKFVLNQETCRQHWRETEKTCLEFSKRAKELEHDNEALKTKLKHARYQIEIEMTKRKKIEEERDAFERQILVVRELLNDKNRTFLDERDRERLAFLSTDCINFESVLSPKRNNLTTIDESGSLPSPSDVSYDKTEEDLDGTRARNCRSTKRPSVPHGDGDSESLPSGKRSRREERKRHRRSNSADFAAVAAIAKEDSEAEMGVHQRRFSTPGPASPLLATGSHVNLRDIDGNDERAVPRSVGRRNPGAENCGMKRIGSANSLSKIHVFTTKNFYKQDLCAACGKKPRFGSKVAKCKDCRLVAHQECKDLLPLPCIPTPFTPAKNTAAGFLADYVSAEPPMIPALVKRSRLKRSEIRCVEEVTSRGVKEEGIYRLSGSDKEVKELKEKFLKGKVLPNLSLVSDIHVVCGCLKDFLRGLKEPLVTYRLWNSFASVTEKSDEQESSSDLYQAISELPQPNRDTLAYIILHLQKISEISACKMPADNLAMVFGPTVVGYSTADPTMNQIMSQTKTQQMIMKKLMAISSNYWSMYTTVDSEVDCLARGYCTPEVNYRHLPKYNLGQSGSIPVPSGLLGPVDVPLSGTYGKKAHLATKKKQQFFDSPDLK